MTDCIDKDLFGQPIIPKAKKKRAAAAMPSELPKTMGTSWGVTWKSWLKRFMGDTAHETAVKLAATFLTGVILAGAAQWKWDWIGGSKAGIGEWTTMIRPGE